MIEITNVRKVFNAGRPNEFTAIRDVNLTMEPGRIVVVRGPSGSGKTTLLTVLGCMARPTSGRVKVFGREVTSLPERFLAEIRRSTFGFIFQNFNLIQGMTVLDNVMIPAYPTGLGYRELRRAAQRVLDCLHMLSKAGQAVETLSGGEQQRVAIARALINNPRVVIADEPTAHLDTELAGELVETIAALKEGGKTVIMTSHDPLVCASARVDHWVEIRDGVVTGETRRSV